LKKIITSIIAFVFPSFLTVLLLRILGHKLGRNVKIGFSFIYCDTIEIGNHAKIGHLNLLLNDSLFLQEYANIGYLNILKGPFSLRLKKRAALGNKNYLTRAKIGITYGKSVLTLGELTKITTSHHLDLTRSIEIGDFSILAGIRSQMWTHGYYHADQGKDRIRIDGEIQIGNNVYIGSGCIFNPGIEVSDSIHIGGGSVVSKSLTEKGMYVGQGLRYISNDLDRIKPKLKKVDGFDLLEQVYAKVKNE